MKYIDTFRTKVFNWYSAVNFMPLAKRYLNDRKILLCNRICTF